MSTTLLLGDCIDVMRDIPSESVDLILTDPPYGIDYQSNWSKTLKHSKILGDKAPCVWFLPQAYRTLNPSGAALVFCRWDVCGAFTQAMEWAGFQVKNMVIWDRMHHGMGDLRSSFAPTYDTILFGVKGKYFFPNKRPKDVLSIPRVASNKLVHPNEKPVELMRRLLEATVPTCDATVLDPFMGVGPVGVACVQRGCSYIGIEIDQNYYDIACERIRGAEARGA